jgi:hypothetical protein
MMTRSHEHGRPPETKPDSTMTEKGLPIPDELIKAVVSGNLSQPKTWSPNSQLRSGIINISIGLGLMVLLLAVDPSEELWWGVGAVPFIIGLGFFGHLAN